MSGRLNSLNILALFVDGTTRDILQEGIQIPDIKLDFFSGELPDSLSDVLSSENYDLILLDKSIKSGFEKILGIVSRGVRYTPVVLLGQEENIESNIFSKNIWDYCKLKDSAKLNRLIGNFKRLKYVKLNESGISEFIKIRDQYTEILTENAKEGIVILQDGMIKYADPQIVGFFNTSLEELKLIPFIEFIHPEDKKAVISIYKKRVSGTEIAEKYTFRVISRDGGYASIENAGFMIVWEGRPATLNLVTEVTERIKSETNLRNSEEKYRSVVHSSPNGILILDHEGVIVDMNSAFLDIGGFRREDYLNRKVIETPGLNEDQRKKASEYYGKLISGEEVSPFEIRFTRIDGEIRYAEIRIRIIIPSEETSGVIAICSDITEKKLASEKIANSERRFRELLEKMIEATISVDLNGVIIDFNKAFHRLTLSSKEGLIGKNLNDFIPDEWRKEDEKHKNEALERGYCDSFELNIKREKQHQIPVEVLCYLREDDKGEPEGYWYFFKDIQKRKQFENDLADSEIQLKTVLEYSPVSVIITDTDGKIEYVNPKFAETSGYTYEEVLGKNPSILKSGNTSEELYKSLWDTITSGKQWKGEIQNKTKSGKLYWESASISGVKSDKGEVTHFVGIKEDITDRKNAITEMQEAKDKAEESDRLKTAFLANMSHEIRTPMNAIVGFSELLRTTNVLGPEREEYFNIINNSCNILSNLIDDIIDLAKIEAGQTTIAEDLCRPYELMRELQRYFEEEIKKLGKPIKLVMDASIDPDMIIKSDEFRLRQILSNIIGNAVKFTEKGIIAWGCTVEKERNIKFFVKDTGIGISPENIKLVFDRFRQMDDSSIRKYGGTGLGLPVSKSLVDLMGGEIWVESQIGKGSEFYFTIPYKPVKGEPYKENEVLAKSDLEFSFKNKGVLVVEDNLSNFEFIKAVLSRTKAKLFWADTGVKAVEIFRKKRKYIHLVLMDIQIPEMDGYEATRLMKKMRPDIPIIAQTAFAMSRDKEKSLDAGCDDYISKPIKPSDLLNMLAKYLLL